MTADPKEGRSEIAMMTEMVMLEIELCVLGVVFFTK